VKVTPNDILFSFSFTRDFVSLGVPLAFDVGQDDSGLISLSGDGALDVTAGATLNIGFGIKTGDNISLANRFYLDTSAANEISVHVTANAGYDTNDNGLLGAGEGSPIDLNVQVGPLELGVQDARFLLDLTAGADLSASGNQLTINNLGSASVTPK